MACWRRPLWGSRKMGFAFSQDDAAIPSLFDLSLEELRVRLEELDRFSRAEEFGDEDLENLRVVVFARGGGPEDAWNDYHLVRNEYDRRAAEEFDLGQ